MTALPREGKHEGEQPQRPSSRTCNVAKENEQRPSSEIGSMKCGPGDPLQETSGSGDPSQE